MALLEDLGIDKNKIIVHLECFFLQDLDLANEKELMETLLSLVRTDSKLLRSSLLLAGAEFGAEFDSAKDELYKAAAIIEAIHLSSLIHDDIIDEADTRRNEQSLNVKIGNRKAVFIGSYIFTRAVELLSEYTDYRNHIKLNNGLRLMCVGEINQMKNKFDFDMDLKRYYDKSKAKTAGLISACLYSGAILTKTEKSVVDKLEKIGRDIGLAFQIIDDILDFTQDEKILGKPSGSDFIKGNVTLPAIYAMKEVKKIIPDLKINPSKENLLKATFIIKNSSAIKKSYLTCDKLLGKARMNLNKLTAPEEAKRKLEIIIDYISSRKY